MNRTGNVSASDLTRIVPRETALTWAEQRYCGKIELILVTLHTLLPRYRNSVDPGQYAYDQDELMTLTVAYYGGSSGLGELEVLLRDAKRCRQVFCDALGLSPELDVVADDPPD